ncbi:hypothetical protein D3C84_840530 [compost metagenome]
MENLFLQEARLKPFPEYRLVHRDMVQQPLVVYVVEATFDITFQNPRGTATSGEIGKASFNRVRAASHPSKSIGTTVRDGFRNRIKREQM